jgi:poly(3-hydroxybutyrate) depolymerase
MKKSTYPLPSAYAESEQLTAKGFLLIIGFLVLCVAALAQPCPCTGGRYLQTTFGKVSLGTNVQYTQNASGNFDGSTEHESMDIWGPAGDNCNKRPAIIWVHGGGFSQMDRTAPDVVAMCDTFARHGFVVASIDYRDDYWGMYGPVNDFNSQNPGCYDNLEFTRAAYRAMQDAKCAVRYFKSNAATYGIDTGNIFMGGTSAGGWTSLLVAYLDKASEKPAACAAQSTVAGMYARPDLGGIDGGGGWNNVSSRVRGIISIFGAAFDTSIVDGPGDPAAYFFHEYSDPVVNFYYGPPFQGQYQNFASYWGDYYMHMQAQNLGATVKARWQAGSQHALYPYRGIVSQDVAYYLDSLICAGSQTSSMQAPALLQASLFPNPSQGTLSVYLPAAEGAAFRLYSLLGEEIYSAELREGNNILELPQIANGAYEAVIVGGSQKRWQRLIVNR